MHNIHTPQLATVVAKTYPSNNLSHSNRWAGPNSLVDYCADQTSASQHNQLSVMAEYSFITHGSSPPELLTLKAFPLSQRTHRSCINLYDMLTP